MRAKTAVSHMLILHPPSTLDSPHLILSLLGYFRLPLRKLCHWSHVGIKISRLKIRVDPAKVLLKYSCSAKMGQSHDKEFWTTTLYIIMYPLISIYKY